MVYLAFHYDPEENRGPLSGMPLVQFKKTASVSLRLPKRDRFSGRAQRLVQDLWDCKEIVNRCRNVIVCSVSLPNVQKLDHTAPNTITCRFRNRWYRVSGWSGWCLVRFASFSGSLSLRWLAIRLQWFGTDKLKLITQLSDSLLRILRAKIFLLCKVELRVN